MPAIDVVEKARAIQYDGTNSAEIDSLVTDFTIVSEGGGTLTFTSGGSNFIAATNDWVKFGQGIVVNTYTPSFFDFAFSRNALYSDVEALQTQVSALTGGLKTAGIKEVPAIALPSTINVDVDLTVTLSSTTGRTINTPRLFAPAAVLAILSTGTPSFLSTSVVRVPVTATGILALSAARVLVTVT